MTGRVHPGEPFNRGYIYKILHQRTYLGDVVYKGVAYPGEHAEILDRALWDRVHAVLAESRIGRGNRQRQRSAVPGFLKGVVRCGHCGSAMTMAYTRKKDGRMYRYYRCVKVTKGKDPGCPLSQITAGLLEAEVLKHLRRAFRAPGIIAATSQYAQRAGNDQGLHLDHAAVLEALRSLDQVWDELFPGEQERVVEQLVDRLVVGFDHSDLHLRLQGINGLASELRGYAGVEILPDGRVAVVRLAISARRRCGRTLLLAPANPEAPDQTEPDAMVLAIARAFRWQEQIETGQFPSVQALADHEGVDEAYVRRQLQLPMLSPQAITTNLDNSIATESIKDLLHRGATGIWPNL